MRANALTFIDQRGAEAHRLGWTAEQRLGVDPKHGFLRVEYAGAPMVNGSRVVRVDPAAYAHGLCRIDAAGLVSRRDGNIAFEMRTPRYTPQAAELPEAYA